MSFTQAVHEELKGTGVKCMVLVPGFTRTEFQVRAGFDSSEVPGFLWQDAPTVVQHALPRLRPGPGGVRAGPAQCRDRRVHRGHPAVGHAAHRRGHRQPERAVTGAQAGSTRKTSPASLMTYSSPSSS